MEKDDKNSSSSHGSDSNSSYDDDDDIEEEKELVPYRPELEYVNSQTITLLIPPASSPPHPKTVFFINDPKLNENPPLKNVQTEEVTIKEKKYMFLYKAYKNLPLCLSGPMKSGKVDKESSFFSVFTSA